MNIGMVERSQASSTPSPRRRRGAKGANQPDRLNRRDIEFMHQTVTVVKKIGEFGTSYIYSAKDDSKKARSGRSLLIKATAAGTTEEARRAEAEVRLFRKLSEAPGILKMIDCGFSTIDERVFDYGATGSSNDDAKLDVRRLYCTLFEPCHDYFLSDFIKKRRRKYDKRRSRGLFARKKKNEHWEGYLPLSTILDIFSQMASAISALHGFVEDGEPMSQEENGENDEPATISRKGIVHLDIQPSRFLIRNVKDKSEEGDKYEVNLCSFGCSIRGEALLTSNMDRDDANEMIESITSPMYRSPEMINLHMADDLNGRYALLLCS
jgi:serine/threonine protein kinase